MPTSCLLLRHAAVSLLPASALDIDTPPPAFQRHVAFTILLLAQSAAAIVEVGCQDKERAVMICYVLRC